VVNGKLVGVNVVAVALDKVAGAPGVSQLVTDGDPDTELDQASMTFVMNGERVMTHDLTIRSSDYGITADGWFDLQKRLDMDADITLVRGLDVAIPVVVSGGLPVPLVLPNIPRLTETRRAGCAGHAWQCSTWRRQLSPRGGLEFETRIVSAEEVSRLSLSLHKEI
jgi:hypothetical protein